MDNFGSGLEFDATPQQIFDYQNRMTRALFMILISKGIISGTDAQIAISVSAKDADEKIRDIMETIAISYLGISSGNP